MLSFLKMLQNDQKHGSGLHVLLWRHLTPQRKTIIWVHNYTYTPSGVQLPQSYSGKLTSCMTFDVHKHVCSEPFLNYLQVWRCWRHLATCGKFCTGIHMYILCPKPPHWHFIKIFLLSIQSGAHKLFCWFFHFSQFNHNFAKVVAPPGNKNENYLAHLKGQSLLKKRWKRHQNRS